MVVPLGEAGHGGAVAVRLTWQPDVSPTVSILRERFLWVRGRPTRMQQPELMDDPALPEADHLCALDALCSVNFISRTSSQLAAASARLAAASGRIAKAGDLLKIVDVACGGGDVTVDVACKLARIGFTVEMLGLDKSSRAIARARRCLHTRTGARVVFEEADVLACDIPPLRHRDLFPFPASSGGWSGLQAATIAGQRSPHWDRGFGPRTEPAGSAAGKTWHFGGSRDPTSRGWMDRLRCGPRAYQRNTGNSL